MEVYNIKTLKEAIKGLSDETPIFCQVVAEDGTAWNLWCDFTPPTKQFNMATIQLKHESIKSMPEIDYEYEMFIDDEGTPFEINSWIPIATDRTKDPSRIDNYIERGLLRKVIKL
jgi:hypothetical protein